MYKSFRVKNFRCFKDLQINDLGRVNLIAGKNNTGKTALMEAMYIHSGNRDPMTLLRSNVRYDYASVRSVEQAFPEPMTNISWNVIFNNFCTKEDIELSATFSQRNNLAPELKLSVITQYQEGYDEILRNVHIFNEYISEILVFKSGLDAEPFILVLTDMRVFPTYLSNQKLITNSEFLMARKKVDTNVNAERFSNMRQSGTDKVLVDALKLIEPRLKKLEILAYGGQPHIHADIELDQLISVSNLGDGMNRISSLILAMSEVPGGVVFIDEIENGIHHSVQKKVWKAIGQVARDLDIQVFATTHSLEMIRAAYEAFRENKKLNEFRYHRLDRDRDTGDIEAVTYNEFGMDAVAAFDFEYEVRG
ncbi:MAG: AAA family ATPase [Chloroflexi bacterium]|nr:AAA family ATPase [Chloroflexota bacterium]